MRSAISPFKKKSHSRESSHDERLSSSNKPRRTPSAGSGAYQHSRTTSGSAWTHPPVSGSNSHRRTTSRSSNSSQSSNFLAEQYDRDRTAIIKYCFSKPDSKTNNPPNSYLTHVRIIEDARYPSSRPAADSKLENKKKRVIIISAKANDQTKIFVHKARENSDGSFQIGRTWSLKELTCVERDDVVPEGFIFTMGKKYYWETNSAKERTVFIRSIIRTYMDTYDGHVPELINWDLGTFYLDERSYQRAVIQKKGSNISTNPSSPIKVPATAPLPSTHYQKEQQQQKQQPIGNQTHNIYSEPTTAPVIGSTIPTPGTRSLNRTPYSSNSTINEVSNKYAQEQKERILDQRRAEEIRNEEEQRKLENAKREEAERRSLEAKHAEEKRRAEEQRMLEEQRRQQLHEQQLAEQKLLEAQREEEQRLKDEEKKRQEQAIIEQQRAVEKQKSNEKYQKLVQSRNNAELDEPTSKDIEVIAEQASTNGSNSQVDHLLEDINAVLSDTNQPRVAVVQPVYGGEPRSKDLEDYSTPVPIPLPDTSIYNEQEDIDLNATIDEEENDLSFREGDEQRYSQTLDNDHPHVYHQVSTIQEEDNRQIPSMDDDSRDLVPQSKSKLLEISDEAILETLNDINWEMGDNADKLLVRLDSQLRVVEHSLNKSIVELQNLGPSLLPYEQNVEKECAKMNPAFSLFLMEMNNFSQDIEYVERQHNGLQIESANKKLLWNTLSELLNTVSLDETTLKELLKCPIRERNLPWMESQLSSLSKALKAISGETNKENYSLRDMEALKKRRQYYEKVTELFLERVVEELSVMFVNINKDTTSDEQLINILSRLLTFSTLTMFCKEVSKDSYNAIIEQWNKNIQKVYSNMSQRLLSKLKAISDHPDGDQGSLSQQGEKLLLDQWKVYKASRKTIKTEPVIISKLTSAIKALDFIEHHCIVYQNFVNNFFHISSEQHFEDFVVKYTDINSRMVPLDTIKKMESDRESASIQMQMVSRVFQPMINQIATFFWDMYKSDQSTPPSIMVVLEHKIKKLESSNQEFLFNIFTRILAPMKQLWSEFIEDQILYADRVSSNLTNREILPPIRLLPVLLENLHDGLVFTTGKLDIKNFEDYETNELLSTSCSRLCLSTVNALDGSSDYKVLKNLPKKAFNEDTLSSTITLLVNYNWLSELLSLLNVKMEGIFDDAISKSNKEFDIQKDEYATYLLNDAMPKLNAFVEGAAHLFANGTNQSFNQGAYSKQNLENILSGYTSSEIHLLVKKLHKHLLHHFSIGQPQLMKDIIHEKLWSCLQGQTVSLYLKLYTLIDKHYKGIHVKFTKNDIIAAFEEYKE